MKDRRIGRDQRVKRRRSYLKNREREIHRAIAWRKAHPELVAAQKKRWRQENKDKVNAAQKIYRAKRKAAKVLALSTNQ